MLNLVAVLAFHSPALLDRVKIALAAPGPAWATTVVTGAATYYGEKQDYRFSFDSQGRFLVRFTGPLGETFGYDGGTFWQVDRSRAVEKLDFEDRDKRLAMALILSSRWLSANAPVAVTQEGNTLHLRLKTSGQVETIKIDPATSLPTEARLRSSSGDFVIRVGDWRAAGDRKIPAHAEVAEGGQTDTLEGTTVEAGAETSFGQPKWKPDVSFDPGKPSTVDSKRAISGHILVHPLVNGKDVGWFILDSGAEIIVLDKATADELKLPSIGHDPVTGVGGTVQSSFRPIDTFTLGPATLSNIYACDLDLEQIGRMLGIRLGGIVGADLFRRAVVAMDLSTASVDLYDRETYALPSGKWMPIRFSTGNPAIEATVAGAPKAWFRFDTGANGTLTIHSPFVRRYNLLKGVKTIDAGAGGVGGMISAKAGRVKWFDLAGHRFTNPLVTFATDTKGAFAEPYLAGNIGHEFMKPFQIVLDFSGYRMALLPK